MRFLCELVMWKAFKNANKNTLKQYWRACFHSQVFIYFFLAEDDLIFIIMPSFWKFTHPSQKAKMMQII